MGTGQGIKMMVAAGQKPQPAIGHVRVFDCEAAKGRSGIGQVSGLVALHRGIEHAAAFSKRTHQTHSLIT
ncbi:Uncharacterised protein [Mycobacterium tuberculosis]|uniref:Uncharacterized protein n=2 Tax=Mycobacterium tuberculosis TaxID=1773 RepID=A0A0T7PUB5_MYCTX|nr:Uncharacterised protein [Mycobacterium tuberculosis]CFJ14158.1 Uncharacterised protein [Mycobacterium tuberculosis]CFJ45885.1 Uncharacterised protein [Mycobacterium tuberculosis]CFS17568.1 Uncharacterised protein [Mycobacterium tuberculosis]CFS26511.1 Uncharacterised protein [Mycobacterium tuberculosis]